MRWENCHEYFLSKDFRDQHPELSNLLDDLSFSIRTSDRLRQRKTAMKLIAIANKREVPKIINQFKGTTQEAENYLNDLNWSPVHVFCDMDGDNVNIITIR